MDTSDTPSSKDLQSIEGQITLLSELTARVESLRQTPAYLRPTAVAVPIPANVSASAQVALVRQGFEQLKEFLGKIQSRNEPTHRPLARNLLSQRL